MAYATYDDYLLLYRGVRLTEEEFLSAAETASAEVDRYVFGRISAGGNNRRHKKSGLRSRRGGKRPAGIDVPWKHIV